MRILIVADPHLPVPPSCYGGSERVIAMYAAEFARHGHCVDLLSAPGSRSFGGRLFIHRPPSTSWLSRAYHKIRFQVQALLACRGCDVVFNHGRLDYLEALLFAKKPLLHQFHSPVDQTQINFLEKRIRESVALLFISNSQRSGLKLSTPAFIAPNPVDSKAYKSSGQPGGYLVFLGRLTRNKGVDVAIKVAHQTGMRLVIAGNVSAEEGGPDFFQNDIQPHLDGVQITWMGPVNDHQKRHLLAHADALLFPIRWDEPFGLVMVEALACGCPVIATRRASTPEVIDHGLTGFLCDPSEPSVDSFVEAVTRLPEIDRNHCRLVAQSRFDLRVVAPQVLTVLEQLATSRL